jgi:ribose transport system substrate-binding protein
MRTTARFRATSLAAAVIFSLGLAGCSSPDSSSGGSSGGDKKASDIKVGVVAGSAANPAVQVMNDASKKRADELGVDLLVETSESVDEQIEKADAMIAQGVDYLGIHPWDGEAVVPLIKSAAAQGVKVVILIDGVPGVVESGDALTFISGNERAAAEKIGQWAAEQYTDPTEAAVITGTPGNLSAQNRTEGFVAGVKGSSVSVVAQSTANWARDESLRVTGDVLTANPDIGLIFANNDEMGYGALSAVNEAGRGDAVDIIGWNGTCVGLEALLKGDFVLEAVLPFDQFGAGLIDAAVDDAAGKDVPAQIEPEVPLLTQQDAKDILDGKSDVSDSLKQRVEEADAGKC